MSLEASAASRRLLKYRIVLSQPLSPNIDNIDLAPDGTDFSDCAAPEAAEPVLDLSALNLAPEGAELLEEEYRNKHQATAPATDHIALED